MATYQEILTAAQGTFVVNDGNNKKIQIDAIITLEDTLFRWIKVDGVDVTADYMSDINTAVKAGAFIRPLNGQQFSDVQLISGSVILVL